MTELIILELAWRSGKIKEFEKSRQNRHPGESRGPDTGLLEARNRTIKPGFRLESIQHLMRDRNALKRNLASFSSSSRTS
jgi:hypothetical protein